MGDTPKSTTPWEFDGIEEDDINLSEASMDLLKKRQRNGRMTEGDRIMMALVRQKESGMTERMMLALSRRKNEYGVDTPQYKVLARREERFARREERFVEIQFICNLCIALALYTLWIFLNRSDQSGAEVDTDEY